MPLRRDLVVVPAAVVATAVAGSLASDPGSAWYQDLDKPSWQPPGAVFGPVWTALYATIAVAGVDGWRRLPQPRRRRFAATYAANLVLNAGWSWMFFRAHRPTLAAVESFVLLASTLELIRQLRPHSPRAAVTLVPYAAWVAFATVLTAEIARRNP